MGDLPETMLNAVKKHAKRGDADNVLKVIHEQLVSSGFRFVMNIGPNKGAILEKIFKKCNPTTAIEFGSYMGYSAIWMGRLLKGEHSHLYAVERNHKFADVVRQMVEYAGLSTKVTVVEASASEAIPMFKKRFRISKIDFAFIDHDSSDYKSDLMKLEKSGLVQKGSVIVADNIVFPGVPDYLEYVTNNPRYKSTMHPVRLQYAGIADAIGESICLK